DRAVGPDAHAREEVVLGSAPLARPHGLAARRELRHEDVDPSRRGVPRKGLIIPTRRIEPAVGGADEPLEEALTARSPRGSVPARGAGFGVERAHVHDAPAAP